MSDNRPTMKALDRAISDLEQAAIETGIYRILKRIPKAMAEIAHCMEDIHEIENAPVIQERQGDE